MTASTEQPKFKRLTKKDLALSLFAAGRTIEDIATALETHPSYVANVLAAAGKNSDTLPTDAPKQSIPVPAQLTAPGAYCLRVKGDKMRGEGILDRDIVVIRPAVQAEDGQLVAILVGDEAMVRTARMLPGLTQFECPGAPWGNIYANSEGVQVIGHVIGLMRSYPRSEDRSEA